MAKKIWAVLVALVTILVLFLFSHLIVDSLLTYKSEYKISDHYNGNVFNNLHKTPHVGFTDVLKWKLLTKPDKWETIYEPRSFDKPPAAVNGNDLRVSFVGHLTFLLQVQGINILTDPIWSERASPFSFIGPKRFIEPGIKFDDLPKIDIVLISHNHYDHLDVPTLKMLKKHSDPLIIVPIGNAHVIYNHIHDARVLELDWWSSYTVPTKSKNNKPIIVNLVPAHHWSARGLFDRNKSLWGSFVLELAHNKQLCILGDTSYQKEIFEQISSKFKNIYLSIIPIGAYHPSWIMKDSHMNPEEAVKAHIDLKSRFSIPSHYGTFQLSDESNKSQILDFQKAVKEANLEKSFYELRVGENAFYTLGH